MAIEFMDNFSNYGTDTSNLVDGLYSQIDGVIFENDPDGISGGKVIRTSNGYRLRRSLSAAKTTVGVGFRIWPNALPIGIDSSPAIICFNDTDNEVQVSIRLNTDGTLTAYRGNIGTVLGSTSTPVITASAWTHVEAKVLFSQTVGTVEIRINGVTKLSLTGLDTVSSANVNCTQVRFGNGNGLFVYMKDLIVWNGDGSFNNDFVGDVSVVTLLPTSDVSFNWTPSTGVTGYNLIDETTPDDADYISADATPPAASTFTLTDLDEDVTSVKGLMMVGRMMKTDGGDAQVQMSLISNGDLADGQDRPITTTQTYWTDVSETDPDTAAAWTRAGVNAATIKINRTV